MKPIPGLHHVTAIVSDAQRTLDFYTQVLGLRLVKRTVNFDDPGSYHLYFGDDAGSPGTILTFFAWPGASRGKLGVGETEAVAFSVPAASISFWEEQLQSAGVTVDGPLTRFGVQTLSFVDPDGMRLEIAGDIEAAETRPSRSASIPVEHSIGGFFGVTLGIATTTGTEGLLARMGFVRAGNEAGRIRFSASPQAETAIGRHIDLSATSLTTRGRMGAGTVHHIAFRNADDADQAEWREGLSAFGMEVTPVMDRTYFHSIYFREPGGVLFEMATDPPGFALDEPIESLGEAIKLPPWLEGDRARIEKALPPLAHLADKGAVR